MNNSENPDTPYELVGEVVSIYRRNNRWYAYYRRDGQVVRRSLKTQYVGKARKQALEIERQLAAGENPQPRQPPLIAEAVEEYLAHVAGQQRAAKTIQKYRHCLQRVLALAAERDVSRLHQLDHRFIDAFRNGRVTKKGVADPKTIKNDLVTIRQLINFALRRGLLAEDPLKGLELPNVPFKLQPFWTADEAQRVLTAAKPRYQPYYQFLWLTGARASEAAWLTWDDVDFASGVVHIRAKEGWRPKTGDERAVHMSDELRQLLDRQPRQWRWVFTARPSAGRPQPGRQIDVRRSLSALKTVLKKLGLKGCQHTFRHSFISHALTRGVPEAIVRSWVGHVDARILKMYTHVASQVSREAMSSLFPATKEPSKEDRPSP